MFFVLVCNGILYRSVHSQTHMHHQRYIKSEIVYTILCCSCFLYYLFSAADFHWISLSHEHRFLFAWKMVSLFLKHLYFESTNFARSCCNQSNALFSKSLYSLAIDIVIGVDVATAAGDWNSIIIPVALAALLAKFSF